MTRKLTKARREEMDAKIDANSQRAVEVRMQDARLLRSGATEISGLRRANELLQARVDTMDLMAAFMFGQPGRVHGQGGAAPDIAYEMQKRAGQIELGDEIPF